MTRASTQISAFDAKNGLGRLLDRVVAGEELVITRRGEPVAKLVPVDNSAKDKLASAIETFREVRTSLKARKVKVSRAEVREWRDEAQVKCVVDASVIASFYLPDEVNPKIDRFLNTLIADQVHAPALLQLEVTNTLLVAQRRKRISSQDVRKLYAAFESLPIHMEPIFSAAQIATVLQLAEEHALTAYDAAYLELAMRLDISLLSLDKALVRASKAEGVSTPI